MTRYFFDTTIDDVAVRDEEGGTYDTLEAAEAAAITFGREMLAHEPMHAGEPKSVYVGIRNDLNRIVAAMTVRAEISGARLP